MALANVALTNTFNEFRIRVNEIVSILNSISGGGGGEISTDVIIANLITANNLVSGRVLIAGANSFITDDSGLTYDSSNNTLNVSGSV